MSASNPSVPRPDHVRWSAYLYVASILVGIVSTLVNKPPEVPGEFHGSGGQVFGMFLISIGVLLLIWLATGRQKIYARIALIAIAVFIIPLKLLGIPDLFSASVAIGVVALAALTMQAVAAMLLCTPSARAWFHATGVIQ